MSSAPVDIILTVFDSTFSLDQAAVFYDISCMIDVSAEITLT